MWPSTMPPTVPNSVAAFAGAPVACRSASGNSAQPSAAVKRTVATGLFVDAGASVNASPASLTSKSAAGLGSWAGASVPSLCAVTKVPSLPYSMYRPRVVAFIRTAAATALPSAPLTA